MAGSRGPATGSTRRPAKAATSRRSTPAPAGRQGRTRREAGGQTGMSGKLSQSARPQGTRTKSPRQQDGRPLQVRNETENTVLGPRGYALRRIGILAVVLVFLVVSISVPVSNHYESVDQARALSSERAQLESEISLLQQEKNKLNDPEYIQAQARQRFGAVKPGETPYRVVDDATAERAAAAAAAEEEANRKPWNQTLWGSISGNRGED